MIQKGRLKEISLLLCVGLPFLPLLMVRFPPMVDLPDHVVTVGIFFETLIGKHPELRPVLAPGYKLFYFLCLPIYSVLADTFWFPRVAAALPMLLFVGVLALIHRRVVPFIFKERGTFRLSRYPWFTGPLLGCAVLTFYSPSFFWGFASFITSIPIVIGSLAAFEMALFKSDRRSISLLGVSLFLAYCAHPFSLIFITIWIVVRTSVYIFLNLRSNPWSTAGRPFGLAILFLELIFVLHQNSLPRAAVDGVRLFGSFKHFFRPVAEIPHYVMHIFWYGDVFDMTSRSNPSGFGLCVLGIMIVAFGSSLIVFGFRSVLFQLNVTGCLSFLFGLSLRHNFISAVDGAIGNFYLARFDSTLLPILLTLSLVSLVVCAIAVDSGRDPHRHEGGSAGLRMILQPDRWMRTAGKAVLVIGVIGLAGQTIHLKSQFGKFNESATSVYRALLSSPELQRIRSVRGLHTMGYPRHWHFKKYLCLWDDVCTADMKFFFLRLPPPGLYPVEYRR